MGREIGGNTRSYGDEAGGLFWKNLDFFQAWGYFYKPHGAADETLMAF
jgi:hypothetical protein